MDRGGTEMNERSRNEFLDQAQAAMQGDDMLVKQAAHSAMERFENTGNKQ